MDQATNKLEVFDKDGWRREYPLEKNIIHIGSDPRSDIILEVARGVGVSPRHIQLLPSPVQGYRLVNMGDTDIIIGADSDRVIAPRSFADIGDGDRIVIGDFTLIFHGGGSGRTANGTTAGAAAGSPGAQSDRPEAASESLGLKLVLPGTDLTTEKVIEGAIVVRNLGDQSGVQFDLEVEGIAVECYEIGPAPVLFSNSEAQVFFRLQHSRSPRPIAGAHQIRIRATAPEAYMGESVVVSQTINILPYYSHTLDLTLQG